MTVAYVWARPNKYMELLNIRNRVLNVVGGDGYFRKQSPHITLIPPFKIKKGSKSDIRCEVHDLVGIEGSQVDVSGLNVHESPKKPFSVFLDVELEASENIERLRDQLLPLSRVPITERSNTHISLFKTKGWWNEVPDDKAHLIDNEISSQPSIDSLTIEEVKVNFKR